MVGWRTGFRNGVKIQLVKFSILNRLKKVHCPDHFILII